MSLWLVLFPFLISLLLFIYKGSGARYVALGASLVLLVITGYIAGNMGGDASVYHLTNYKWLDTYNISLRLGIDGLNIVLLMLSAVVLPVILLATFDKEYARNTSLYGLVFLMIGAMNGVFMALDGFVFYVFWELALLPIYFIAALWGGQDRIRITIKFFIYTFVGSLFMLASLIYMYLQTPAPHDFSIEALLAVTLSGKEAVLVFLGFFLAFAVKIPVFPFHSWQPDTYTVSPSVGSMLLAGIMLKMGTYGAMRWMIGLAPEGLEMWQFWLILLAVIGVVYGAVIALTQNDIKRLIAWSSMSHVGLIAAGILTISEAGWQGAMLHMFNHGVNIVGLFFVADILEKRLHTRNMKEMGGIASKAPVFAVLTAIIVFGTVAIPLTNGFPGEFLLLKSVFAYKTWLGAFATLTIILCAIYMLRMYQLVMFGPTSEKTETFSDLNGTETVGLGIIAFFVLAIGFFPQTLLDFSQKAVVQLLAFVG